MSPSPLFSSETSYSEKMTSILVCFFVMVIGLGLFKYAPITVWGSDIQFDASFHVTLTVFIFYVLWYFIDQNRRWRVPFFIVATSVTAIIAIERLISGAHNEIGVALALVISAVAIVLSRPSYFFKRISF